jgi:hypothetical protein
MPIGDQAAFAPLLELAAHEASTYLPVLQQRFAADFLDHRNPCLFMGKRVTCSASDRERLFWHLVTSGDGGETSRDLDFRRCERLPWVREMIQAVPSARVLCWRRRHNRQERVTIALPDFSHLVSLADRERYAVLITSYEIEREVRREKYRREYEEAAKTGRAITL